MKKILFIGGTFNKENGFPSGLISKIHEELKNYEKTELYLKKDKFNIDFFNGGNINSLHKTITSIGSDAFYQIRTNIRIYCQTQEVYDLVLASRTNPTSFGISLAPSLFE